MNEKVKVASLSVISNTFLIIIKLLVGILTGSVSIISEAIHSSMDLAAAIIAFFSVKVSDTPPDKKHPYGHGKIENISGVIEAILIFIASIWIIYEAINKIQSDEKIESLGLGSLVMLVSAVVNILVSRQLYKVAKKTKSVALEADALHLKADVFTSLGVALGLGLIWLTGYQILDPIVAILVAIFILYEAYQLLKKAFSPLLDAAMDENDLKMIHDYFKIKKIKIHDLRTRKAGKYSFAELHMVMPANKSLAEVHDVCDEVEKELEKIISDFHLTIHPEPEG
ncbi:MAG: cation transporter [Bacteroidetes bacterium GWF2_38_335]|nr:MAG: cation transporter [Bacteroidetes bacterium GWF2_38_335]OFY76964.1 MAG: cation transporter [Bacteroidetes bacterium RIFOXYA12_FULL_38_20]HBS86819.1 cation transporter [Bacteroidales bacterium]